MATIKEFSLVIVSVSDQDRSIDFYVDSLGLEKRTDVPFGDGKMRWVEVCAPASTTGIALALPAAGTEVTPSSTGITFATDDIDGFHAELRAKGVDVDEQVPRMGDPVPPMFFLRDPDGNSLLVVQSPPAAG